MRIVNAEPAGYSPQAHAVLESLGEVIDGPFDRDGLLGAVSAAQVLIVRLAHRVDAELIAAAPRLRFICTATTGLDHIDIEAAEAAGVEVISLKDEADFLRTITATAEHTWGLVLALSRRLPQAMRMGSSGEWDRDAVKGRSLAGRRLGVLGLGRVGRQVAGYGLAFGMEVSATDPRSEGMPGVTMVPSPIALAAVSDVFSIHVPSNRDTSRLVDRSVVAALPEGAFIVNTSRGAILDEAAVLEALGCGALGGVALDVLTAEGAGPLASDPMVVASRTDGRLIVTPHVGGATVEAMAATELFIADRLALSLKGESSYP